MMKMIRSLPWLVCLQVLLCLWLLALCVALWTVLSYVFVERVAGADLSIYGHLLTGVLGMIGSSVVFAVLWARAFRNIPRLKEEDFDAR